jgi:UDP-N-acetylglucosamine:LPS N-acetylglucosamine transferase
LLPQTELTPQRLTQEIFSLLDQPARITQMEDAARTMARPHAVEDLVNLIESLVRP